VNFHESLAPLPRAVSVGDQKAQKTCHVLFQVKSVEGKREKRLELTGVKRFEETTAKRAPFWGGRTQKRRQESASCGLLAAEGSFQFPTVRQILWIAAGYVSRGPAKSKPYFAPHRMTATTKRALKWRTNTRHIIVERESC
jgi:hypothetical protein